MAMTRCFYCERIFDTDEEDHARYEYPLPIMCGACVDEEEEKKQDNERFAEQQRQDWQAIDMDWDWIANNY